MIPGKITAIIGGGALLLGIATGWTVRDWKADGDLVKGFEAVIKLKDENRKEMKAEATRFEDFKQNFEPRTDTVREKIREIYRNAPPVPVECAWSPDVLGLLENHRAVANRAAGGDFSLPVPADTGDPAQRP